MSHKVASSRDLQSGYQINIGEMYYKRAKVLYVEARQQIWTQVTIKTIVFRKFRLLETVEPDLHLNQQYSTQKNNFYKTQIIFWKISDILQSGMQKHFA